MKERLARIEEHVILHNGICSETRAALRRIEKIVYTGIGVLLSIDVIKFVM